MKVTHAHARVGGKRVAQLGPRPGDDVEPARRQPGRDEILGEAQRRERRRRARLEHDGIAGGERRPDLVAGHRERVVERRDRADHADREAEVVARRGSRSRRGCRRAGSPPPAGGPLRRRGAAASRSGPARAGLRESSCCPRARSCARSRRGRRRPARPPASARRSARGPATAWPCARSAAAMAASMSARDPRGTVSTSRPSNGLRTSMTASRAIQLPSISMRAPCPSPGRPACRSGVIVALRLRRGRPRPGAGLLLPVPREPRPAVVERHRAAIRLGLRAASRARRCCARTLLDEPRLAAVRHPARAPSARPSWRPRRSSSARSAARWAAASPCQPKCVTKTPDGCHAAMRSRLRQPQRDVDVRRRRRRQHVRARADADAAGVADVGDAGPRVEEARVMRGVAARVGHLDPGAAERQRLAVDEHAHALGRHHGELAPQPVHVRAVEALRARQQLRRIDQVRRAALVHVHRQVRMAAHERPGGAGMVEVNVRQQQPVQIGRADPGVRERRFQRRRGRSSGPGSTSSTPDGRLDDTRGNRARAAEELQVDDRHH